MGKISVDLDDTKGVPAVGPSDAKIAIVGEAPGREEVHRSKPFVGSSGRLLNQLLSSAGIKRHKCYITNVVKQRPPQNDFSIYYTDKSKNHPTKELLHARSALREEIKEVNPNVTIALGTEALKAVLDRDDVKISNWRGSIIATEVGKVVPSYHPAYIMRMWKHNPIASFDLQRARKESRSPEIHLPERVLLTSPTLLEIREFIKECKEAEYLSYDIETLQLPNDDWFIDCVGLAPSKDYAMCIPFTHPDGTPYWSLDDEIEVRRLVSDVLGDPSIKKIAQNAKYDTIFLERDHIPIRNLWFDTMNMQAVLNAEFPKSLAFLTSLYTREPYYKDTSSSERWIYNAKDAAVTYEVAFGLLRDMKREGVYDFYRNHVHRMIGVFIETEQRGVRVNDNYMEEVEKSINKEIKSLKDKLKNLTGREINVYSVKDMRDYIYNHLGMKKRYNDNDNLDTSKEVLNEFYRKTQREEFKVMMKLRKARSNASTYIKAEKSSDGRIRSSYKVSGTRSGRLSSTKDTFGQGMNLQNVEKEYRVMLIPDEGCKFLGADLSQAENRVVAYVSQDQNMIDVVESEGDIHTNNAALIFDKDPEDITSEERNLGKRITHGSNYMMGKITFGKFAQVPTPEAKKLLQKYHDTYPRVRVWHKEIEREVRQTRTLTNPFGRKRKFYGRLNSSTFREAVSFIPQSTVADVMHRAIWLIYCRLPEGANVMMQLHDEVFVQCPEDLVYECGKIIHESLTAPFEINGKEVSIPSNVLVGSNWKQVSDDDYAEDILEY